ncbi:MAG: VanZ family protein [Oscillospiraceae bacterium]|nr:VanZ family protein [Oscillospiraceae bacterium]
MKQTKNIQASSAWPRILLPCAFGVLYCLCVLPAFRSWSFLWQFGSPIVLSAAVTVLALFLPGGMRAGAVGLNLFLGTALLAAGYVQLQAQLAQSWPGGWIYVFFYDRPMAVLAAALSAFLTACLYRALLPMNRVRPELRQGFDAYRKIAGTGFLVFYAFVLLYGFLLARMESTGYMPPNLVPFRMVLEYLSLIREGHYTLYENIFYFLGNILMFSPMGFFLRGQFRRSAAISILIPMAFSLAMELLQWAFRFGHCDIDDLLLNTLGAALGVLAVWLIDCLRGCVTKGEERSIFTPAPPASSC